MLQTRCFCVIIYLKIKIVLKEGPRVKKTRSIIKLTVMLIILVGIVLVLSADIFLVRPVTPPPINGGSGDSSVDGDNTGNNTDRPGTDEDLAEPPDASIPNWSIEPTVIKNTLTDSSGKVLCETRYSYPSASSNDGSDISAFSQALDRIATDVRLYVEARSELYKTGSSADFSVSPQITGHYTINRFSSEFFSISFIFSETSPEGTVSEARINYNIDILLAPETVTVDAIMNNAVSSVKELLLERESKGEFSLHSSYERLLEGMIDNVWWVSTSGITFSFPGGSIAPASYGEIEVFIERSQLSSMLSEYGKILLNVTK